MKPIDPAFILVSTSPRRAVDSGPAVRVTDGLANDQLLYFTSPSLLADDRRLVFISDRTGQPNLFLRDLATGEQRQLSRNTDGLLKSYVYFDGTPYRGFGKASVSVHAVRGKIYFIQGRHICCADANGGLRVLAELPHGQMTAFTHISADGKRLCVPTTDARCLDGDAQLTGKPAWDIDARIREENLSSWLRVFDTDSGKEFLCERVPQAWVTHVQFSPRNADWILYNHEWPSDCGIRRVWLWNGREHVRLRTEGDGRKREDWTCHEMWERDGDAIIYHGVFADGPAYIGRVKPDGSERVEIPLPAGWKRYGHFTEGKPGVLVSDGYYEKPDDGEPAHTGAWICAVKANWSARTADWIPLCRHGSSWRSQCEHPHPVFNHAADAIYFVSDKDGKRAVYRVALPNSLSS